jgi:Tfp pilus assembly protein PilP
MRALVLLLALAPVSSFAGEISDADYNPIGRRDPFQVPFEFPSPVVAASALERFELSEMRLEGVISGIADARATVTVPGGESFLVRAGTPMGKWGGRVARVTSSEVVVREEFTDPTGLVHVKESTLSVDRTK